MIDMMNTDDDEVNEHNKEMLIEQISDKIKEQGMKVDKEQISNFLDGLRKQ
jgi:hypothetical protein